MLAEEFLKPLNMSNEVLADAMGVSPQFVEDIICGRRRLMTDEGRILSGIFDTDEDFWINLQELQDCYEERRK